MSQKKTDVKDMEINIYILYIYITGNVFFFQLINIKVLPMMME